MSSLLIDQHQVKLSNLDKVFWPEKNITKGNMINYYIKIYPYIKKYLKDRPLALKIYPDGINGHSFYRKNAPDYLPEWMAATPIYSRHRREAINWITVNKLSDLVWVANSGAIELHGWFSAGEKPDIPQFAVFDLDPGPQSLFTDVIETALFLKKILDNLHLKSYIKTSGKTGLHIYLPLKPKYNYNQVKEFLKSAAELTVKKMPKKTSAAWRKKERKDKVYIDYRQNGRGKTIPAPYSLRPVPGAVVSTPLYWKEVNYELNVRDYNLKNIQKRLEENGDPWSQLFENRQELPAPFL